MARRTRRQARRSRRRPRRSRQGQGRLRPNASGAPVNGGAAYGGLSLRGAGAGLPQAGPRVHFGSHFMDCCALANPFDPHCKGMKWPDGENGRSIVNQIRGQNTHTTSGGSLWVEYTPGIPDGYITATLAGSTWTAGAAFGAYATDDIFLNYAAWYRLVCYGVHISVTSAVANSSGTMIMSVIDKSVVPTGTWSAGNMLADEVYSFPVATGSNFVWIGKPSGAHPWVPLAVAAPSSGAAPFGQDIGTSLVIELVGGNAALTTINVEYCFNIEYRAGPGSGIQRVAPPDPPPNSLVTKAAQAVQTKLPDIVEGGFTAVKAAVREAVAEVLNPEDIMATLGGTLEDMFGRRRRRR